MVHRQHRVVMRALRRHEGGVGGQRAEQVHALAAQGIQHRDQRVDFLPPQVAALAGMRIEPEHGDAWPVDAELAAQFGVHDAQHAGQQCGRDRRRYGRQRQVGGGQRNAQLRAGQHHHHLGAGAFGEELGVPAEGDAGVVDGGFLQRCGDHRGIPAGHAAVGSLGQRGQHVVRVARVGPSGYFRRRQRHVSYAQRAGGAGVCRGAVVVDQIEVRAAARRRAFEQVAIGDRDQACGQRRAGQPHQQLRTDAGRLARGDGQPGERHRAQLAWGAAPSAGACSGSRSEGTRMSM